MLRLMLATVFASLSLAAGADPLYDTTNVFKVAYGDEIKMVIVFSQPVGFVGNDVS